MNTNQAVSIILPTYNRAHLLPNAIESVLAQTYPHWELLIWDDGSADETKAVVKSYTDNRIRYFYQPNHGMSYALNQSIQRAKNNYLAFIDDDDQWFPQKLEIQIRLLSQNPCIDLIFGNFININQDDQQESLSFIQNSEGLAQLETQDINGGFLVKKGWLQGITKENFIAFDTVLMPRSTTDQLGLFNEDIRNGMDFEYWWRFGLAGLKAAYTEDILMKRTKIPGSLSGRSITGIENQLKMLDSCAQHSAAYGQPGTAALLRSMVRNAWQNKILFYGQDGDKKNAWRAFLRSLDYGFRLGSAKLLFMALMKI